MSEKSGFQVEYYSPAENKDEESNSSSESDESSDEDGRCKPFASFHKKEKMPKPRISDELAEYGCYARSTKPKKGWLLQSKHAFFSFIRRQCILQSGFTEPANILINISESTCNRLIPTSLFNLISHSCDHLRRIFPKGTRIGSSNFDPAKFWRTGSQVASMNWQVYDGGMQINEAMFVGSPGWVPKPTFMRKSAGGNFVSLKKRGKEKLRIEIVGASSCLFQLFTLLLEIR